MSCSLSTLTLHQLQALKREIESRLHQLDQQAEPSAIAERQLREQLGRLNDLIDEKQGQKTLF